MRRFHSRHPGSANPWENQELHRTLKKHGWTIEYLPNWVLYEKAVRDDTVIVEVGVTPTGPLELICAAERYRGQTRRARYKRPCRNKAELQRFFWNYLVPDMLRVPKRTS